MPHEKSRKTPINHDKGVHMQELELLDPEKIWHEL
jgi:hypothetical protein